MFITFPFIALVFKNKYVLYLWVLKFNVVAYCKYVVKSYYLYARVFNVP